MAARKPVSKAKRQTVSTKKVAGAKASPKFRDHEARERGHRYARIIARAWADDDFKKRLLSDPESVLAEHEIRVPQGHVVSVVTETPSRKKKGEIVFVLPEKPKGWMELDSRPLTASSNDDWLDGGSRAAGRPKPRPKPRPFPCAKCWNGCC
jgi:hypothetical protein